jgi:hypothetical protein
MMRPSGSDRILRGRMLRRSGAKMLVCHGPGNAGCCGPVQAVFRQQDCAVAIANIEASAMQIRSQVDIMARCDDRATNPTRGTTQYTPNETRRSALCSKHVEEQKKDKSRSVKVKEIL